VAVLPNGIADLHRRIRSGEMTCASYVTASLERIADLDGSLHAVIATNPTALEQAEALDVEFGRSGVLRPLHGVTFAVKDNIDTSEMPTTGGSIAYRDRQPRHDATVVRMVRDAGGIVLVKANLHELARGKTTRSSLGGQTLNPWDITYTPGGSSGGTAVAVAAGFTLCGLGTDTGQSVRSPASATSLIGYRPTRGLVSTDGVIPVSSSRDGVGPICLTVDDARRVANVLTDRRIGTCADPSAQSTSAERWRSPAFASLGSLTDASPDSDITHRYRRTVGLLRDGGLTITDVRFGGESFFRASTDAIIPYEWPKVFADFFRDEDASRPRDLAELLASGQHDTSLEAPLRASVHDRPSLIRYMLARQMGRVLALRLHAGLKRARADFFIFPHQRFDVARVGEPQLGRNGFLSSVTGFPAIVIPMPSFAPSRANLGAGLMPSGLEILGPPGSDDRLLDAAEAIETLCRDAEPARRPRMGPMNV
jgi:amidase